MKTSMGNFKRDILAMIFLCTLVVAFFAHLFSPYPKIFATAEIGVNDIWDFNFPLQYFLSSSLKTGHLPLWDPYRASGFPNLAESQSGSLNLYNLAGFGLLPPEIAFNTGYIVIFATTATGMYLFARRQKFSVWISVFIAFLYTFSGFFVTHISHFFLIQTAGFFPLIMYLADKLLRDRHVSPLTFSLFSFVLSQQLFSGHPQMVFISLLGVCIYVIYRYLTHDTGAVKILALFASITTGMLAAGAQLLPTIELSMLSSRGSGVAITELLFYKFPLKHLITFLLPFYFGNPQTGTYPHFSEFDGSLFWENTGYIGILPLFFIPFSLFLKNKQRKTVFYNFFLLVFSLLLMLGGSGPLYFLLLFPLFSFFRLPSRFMILFLFALVSLTGYGLSYLEQKFSRTRLILKIISVIASVQLFVFWYNYHPVIAFDRILQKPETVKYLESVNHGSIYTYLGNARSFGEFFAGGSQNIDRYLHLRNELNPNSNILHNQISVNTYSSLIPRRLSHFQLPLQSSYEITTTSATFPVTVKNLLDIRNVTHIISPISLNNINLRLEKTVDSRGKNGDIYYIYKNLTALPKQYLVSATRLIESFEDFDEIIASNSVNFATSALVEKPLPSLQSDNQLDYNIDAVAETATSWKAKITTNQDALLVIINTFYPGWRAKIDGKETPVLPVNLVNQGVAIPSGEHEIKLWFQPESFYYGLILSILAYIFLFSICLYKPVSKSLFGKSLLRQNCPRSSENHEA